MIAYGPLADTQDLADRAVAPTTRDLDENLELAIRQGAARRLRA